MDDTVAIARLRAGDIEGLEVLVRRYQGTALEAAVLITRDYALAEDLVQAAFLRVYERIAQFDPARPFGPWFLRSVINSALTAVTSRRPESLDAEYTLDSENSLLATLPSLEPAVEDQIAAAETTAELRAALDCLTPGQRSAVILHYYCDLPDREIAAQLAVPAGTVRRRLHDARQRLRHLLTIPPY